MSSVVDIHKDKNGNRPHFDVYIGRRVMFHDEFTEDSKWKNYFFEDLDSYEAWIRDNLWKDLDELDGKVLGCWCINTDKITPVKCHGQILMKLLIEKKEGMMK